MDKKRYQLHIAMQRKQYEGKVCEQCGKEHNHTYGSGRFCSKSCKMSFIASKNKNSKKCKEHLAKNGILHRAKYGTWKCSICNKIFETRAKLKEHLKQHGKLNAIHVDGKFVCPYCKRTFNSGRSLGGHVPNCKMHPNKGFYDLSHKKSGSQLSKNIKAGIIKPSFFGKHHTKNAREKISKYRAKQVMNEFIPTQWIRTKWYKVKNLKDEEFSVRGTWEVNVAKRLNELGIYWIKASPIAYQADIVRHYVPDFFIPSTLTYIEVKGRYTEENKQKMKYVLNQHPTIRIYWLPTERYKKFVNGLLAFDDSLLMTITDTM